MSAPAVYACIAKVSAELAHAGISKARKNQQQGYSFRGIDDVYNALAPILAKHGLVVLPRIISRTLTERESKSGGVLFNVVVEAEFDFVAAEDGSKHVARTFGEAMDSADKATNKAMSAAYKYAAFQAFCIPTEGDNDADAQTPDVAGRRPLRAMPAPDGYQEWLEELRATSALGTSILRAKWEASPANYRSHLTATNKGEWEAIKDAAAIAVEQSKVSA